MSARRLDTVLRVRALREQMARADVVRRSAELSARREAEQRAWEAVRRDDGLARYDPASLVARHTMLANGVRSAKAAGQAVADATHGLETATADWQVTARRLDGIERLVERHAVEVAAELERRDATTLDDTIVSRWRPTDDRRGPAS